MGIGRNAPARALCGVALVIGVATPALAQDRTADNAVTQAEDAFGFSVGRETLGIYSAGNARGFSPTAAGNVRIEGLYFDPAFSFTSLLVGATGIKVGLSAQGYPFAAPSGIVDHTLRRPEQSTAGSLLVNSDSFGSGGIEVNGSLPVFETLALGYGASLAHVEFPDGTSNWNDAQALVARWQPRRGIEIVPFWTAAHDYDDEAGPYYVPVGSFLPPLPPKRRFDGPEWANFRYNATNHGLLASAALGENWVARLGAFRSVNDQKSLYTNLLLDLQPDGTAERLVIADPRAVNRSLSGELRISRSIAEGPRLHVLHLSLRERDARRHYDGSDEVDLGPTRIGEKVGTARPAFTFGEVSRDRVRQDTLGIAYAGRWRDVGELGLSLSRARYRKTTRLPGLTPIVSRSDPWLYNANVAAQLAPGTALYAGYARGLEESGVAPPTASNRNQPLPAIRTSQTDAGIRMALTPTMKLIAGVFDLRRPYFAADAANVFTQVGSIRSRGAEASLSGSLTPRLTLVAGGVLLRPRVDRETATIRDIGERPVGLPTRIANLNLNWRTTFLEGLSLDAVAVHRGRSAATTDNGVFIPARVRFDLGGRYRFKLADKDATLRVQLYNALDDRGFNTAGPGIYAALPGRYLTGYLALDI